MNSCPYDTAEFLMSSLRHFGARPFFPPLVKGGRRGGGQRATRHGAINSASHLGENRVFFPPLVKGGRSGGGQRATRHGEMKGACGCSRRDQLRGVQNQWGEACSFVGRIFARIVPDCSLTTDRKSTRLNSSHRR